MDSDISNNFGAKPKFIPKRRTPYLLQEEVIREKQKEEEKRTVLQNQEIQPANYSALPAQNDSKVEPQINSSELLEANEKPIEKKLLINKNLLSTDTSTLINKINYHDKIPRLYGIQKKLIYYFTECCVRRNQCNTGPITAETMCHITGSTKKTIKKILLRLTENNLIFRKNGRPGKGGYVIFELSQELIDVVKLQSEIEYNLTATNNNSSASTITNNTVLPADWEKIDTSLLIEAFKKNKNLSPQFFNKTQLRTIYSSVENKLTSLEVQESINAFAYGYNHYSEDEPYKSMINPAAVLLDRLKNGEKWSEEKYLNKDELIIFNIYLNFSKNIQEELPAHFKKWLNIDRDIKFNSYRKLLRSNEYYDDHIFHEKAKKDYLTTIWPKFKKQLLKEKMGLSDNQILEKFELIIKKQQPEKI
jgi:predicted transcriptional regulator